MDKKFTGIFVQNSKFYLWVILILVIVITFLNWTVAIPGYLLLMFLVYYSYRSNFIRQKEITSYIENLTFNMDTATKDTLLNFPMPMVVAGLDGRIIWYNSSFREIFKGEELFEKTIHSLIDGLDTQNITEETNSISKDITINNNHYRVLGNFAKIDKLDGSDSFIMLLYFIDITESKIIENKYFNEKVAIGTIVIDNYDDLMASMEDSRRPQMLAEIEKKITRWMGFTEGIIKKYERDKYLFVFEVRYIKEFEEKRFEILDIIKEINIGNKIPVTLSLGFGVNGDSLLENFRFAGASIDLALGRGGDQVVIKNGDSFRFYGGKTRELEKRTKVKARVIAFALRELIDQSPRVLIMGHENGDIDSLGASLGLYRIIKNRGKDAFIVLNTSNPTIDTLVDKLTRDSEYDNMFLSESEATSIIDRKTLFIVVDTHKPSFTESPELLKYTDKVVVIDHHRRGAEFIQDAVLTYQETYASSTCELVSEILQYIEEKIRLKLIEAEALYGGIVVDTKNFTFKTGVRTFEAAAFLRRQGVDTVAVKQLFQNDLKTYIAISNVVREAEILNNKIAISTCPPNTKNAQLISAQAADQLLTLAGLSAAFVLSYTNNNQISISGRSFGDINVQMILEKLGGGGHLTVAGAQLEETSIDDAKLKLKQAIMEYAAEITKES